MAQHDPLTDLPNRALLCELTERLIAGARRADGKLAVLFFDLDRFKPINDSYGHHVGDMLLKEAARRLVRSVREEDVIGRLGGDEFLAVLHTRDERDAARIAEHALHFLRQPYGVDGLELSVGASVGISFFPRDGNDVDLLIQRADAAMYGAKESGRNGYRFFTAELDRQARKALDLEDRMRRALESREFSVFYQALLNPKTGAVAGVEALLRWPQADRTFIDPQTFIPIAEATGLIQPLGAWVLEKVGRQQRKWLDAGLPALPIAVNVSPLQLLHRSFLPALERTFSESGMRPGDLALEVPESVLASGEDESERMLQPLKALGLQITLDGVGSGPSRLNGLSSPSIDTLKLNHSFVGRLPADGSTSAFVDMVLAMGRTLHKEVIAEGVETEETLEFIRARDCELVQGYYLCSPMPGTEFEAWYQGR